MMSIVNISPQKLIRLHCIPPGNRSKHRKDGCDVCETTELCVTGRPCLCDYHQREQKYDSNAVEINVRRKALEDPEFPSQEVGFLLILFWHWQNTVRCRYNAVNFLQIPHRRNPIASPSGRGMGYLLWVQPLIYILPHFLQWCVQYHVILDRVIMALDSTWKSNLDF